MYLKEIVSKTLQKVRGSSPSTDRLVYRSVHTISDLPSAPKPAAETGPIIGGFNVKEVRGATCAETSNVIIFASPYEKPPQLPMGLTKLYIGSNANIRVASSASNIRRDQFQINISGCKNKNLDSAACAWLEISPDD